MDHRRLIQRQNFEGPDFHNRPREEVTVAKSAKKAKRATKKKKARPSRLALTAHEAHEEDHICACDVEFTDADATADADLPPARGGVEVARSNRR
jgi:hypothetical protein